MVCVKLLLQQQMQSVVFACAAAARLQGRRRRCTPPASLTVCCLTTWPAPFPVLQPPRGLRRRRPSLRRMRGCVRRSTAWRSLWPATVGCLALIIPSWLPADSLSAAVGRHSAPVVTDLCSHAGIAANVRLLVSSATRSGSRSASVPALQLSPSLLQVSSLKTWPGSGSRRKGCVPS